MSIALGISYRMLISAEVFSPFYRWASKGPERTSQDSGQAHPRGTNRLGIADWDDLGPS